MKISYNWLKQFIKTDWTSEKISDLLTDLGLEVESVDKYQSVKGGLEGIVVGNVLTCVQHPNADKLKITTVDLGDEDPVQIVCGASNVAVGQKVPVATIGTKLIRQRRQFFRNKKRQNSWRRKLRNDLCRRRIRSWRSVMTELWFLDEA